MDLDAFDYTVIAGTIIMLAIIAYRYFKGNPVL